VTSAGLLGLDFACRGAAAALGAMMAIVFLRDYGAKKAGLAAAMAVSGAAYAIAMAPGLASGWWSPPLTILWAGGTVIFWLWARAAFDDDFTLKPWHAALWAAVVAVRLLFDHGGALGPLLSHSVSTTINHGATALNLVLSLLAVAQTVTTWGSDLVAGRRQLRLVVLIASAAYIAADTAAGLTSIAAFDSDSASGNFGRALGGAVVVLVFGWCVLRADWEWSHPATASTSGALTGEMGANDPQRLAVDPAVLRRLERLMSEERVYRREGLTIGALAAILNLPEYRLRQVINEGLGYRNFNAFLNRYRLDEAKAALADLSQKDVSVLTIAMDAGFQSIGPFNRAFKADAGVTPTEFRRLALAKAADAARLRPSPRIA
jgi:AraC-like DNA-binding protein